MLYKLGEKLLIIFTIIYHNITFSASILLCYSDSEKGKRHGVWDKIHGACKTPLKKSHYEDLSHWYTV